MTQLLWSFAELADVFGVPPLAAEGAVTGVQFDSRAVRPGDLFFALPGKQTDGGAYVAQAHANGAAAAVVHTAQPGLTLPQFVVPQPHQVLEALARAARQRLQTPVVAVAGSVGKTTTTAMLVALLEAHGPEGSLNNHVGVPLTLARCPRDARAMVAEVGTNAPGEVAPLARLVRPDVALITNIEPEHLEGLGDMEGVRLEELSITQGLSAQGILVVPQGTELAGSGWTGTVKFFNPAAPLPLILPESTQARIACANAALAVLEALKISPSAAAMRRLAQVLPGAGRGAVSVHRGITVVDDSYNANPASMAAALNALHERPATRRIAVLGDMRELGSAEVRYHQDVAADLEGLDGVVLLGPLMQHLRPLLPPAQVWEAHANPDDFNPITFASLLTSGDVVLVKGSKSITYVRKIAPRLQQALEA